MNRHIKPRMIEISEQDDLLFFIGSRPLGYSAGKLIWCSADLERMAQIKEKQVSLSEDDGVMFALGFEPMNIRGQDLVWDEIALECLEDYRRKNPVRKKA